ncbi:MAG: hypothetical protein K2X01_06200 [Cyanobacteria bacterium]|nr:hypothetical protein [Cyanobacteriota bacterium]
MKILPIQLTSIQLGPTPITALKTPRVSASPAGACQDYASITFGSQSPWLPLSKALKRHPGLQAYQTEDKPIDLQALLAGFPLETQKRLSYLGKTVRPQSIQTFQKSGKLGMLEECADLIFEFYKHRGLQSGLIRQKLLGEARAALSELRTLHGIGTSAQKPHIPYTVFQEALKRVGQLIPKGTYQRFVDEIALQRGDRERLDSLIPLLILNTSWCLQTPEYQNVGKRLQDELAELKPYLTPAKKLLLSIYVSVFEACDWLPTAWFAWLPKKLTAQALGLGPIKMEDLYRIQDNKQRGRQELEFYHPGLKSTQAKPQLKPFEALFEVSILQELQARQLSA